MRLCTKQEDVMPMHASMCSLHADDIEHIYVCLQAEAVAACACAPSRRT